MTSAVLVLAVALVGAPPDDDRTEGPGKETERKDAPARKSSWWPWGRKEAAAESTGWSGWSRFFSSRSDGKSDEMLLVKCRGLIYSDRELSTCPIRVGVERRVATLEGSVPSPVLAERAERLARKTEGLKSVSNLLRISVSHQAEEGSGGVRLSAPVVVGPPIVPRPLPRRERASLEPSAIAAPARESVLVSRPQIVSVAPDLPRVTMYTLRRSRPEDRPLVRASAEVAGQGRMEPPRLAPSRLQTPARSRAFVAPSPLPAEPANRDPRVDEILRAKAGAGGMDYSLSEKNLQLTGVVDSPTTLVEVMTALAELPGFERVVVDPASVVIRER